MGRGRQKAKQTKVARQLKYFSPETDYAALERELASRGDGGGDGLRSYETTPAADDDEWDDYSSRH